MADRVDSLDLDRLRLSAGEGRRLDPEVALDPLRFAGETYAPRPEVVRARLDISRTTGQGYALRLRFEAVIGGPCMRCLEPAEPLVAVDAREVEQPNSGEELSSPYVRDERLDLHAWARDALALALPAQVVCREDCAGLCGVCGENLNDAGPQHEHERPADPRWSKLSELKLD